MDVVYAISKQQKFLVILKNKDDSSGVDIPEPDTENYISIYDYARNMENLEEAFVNANDGLGLQIHQIKKSDILIYFEKCGDIQFLNMGDVILSDFVINKNNHPVICDDIDAIFGITKDYKILVVLNYKKETSRNLHPTRDTISFEDYKAHKDNLPLAINKGLTVNVVPNDNFIIYFYRLCQIKDYYSRFRNFALYSDEFKYMIRELGKIIRMLES